MAFNILVWIWMGIGIITFMTLVFTKIRAPYGRHSSGDWGATISNKWGWLIMELPALLVFPLMVALGPAEKSAFAWLLVGLWGIHYFNRTIVFPWRIKTKGKRMPLAIVFSAIFFNLINGLLNGWLVGVIGIGKGPDNYFLLVFGLLLFFTGMFINHRSDSLLIGLRKEQQGYQIPRGWLFEYISCPNHFGEIIEWTGFAVLAWNLPALSFAVWTFCNLVPRALNHHAWYHEHFGDYPRKRKAVIPGIW